MSFASNVKDEITRVKMLDRNTKEEVELPDNLKKARLSGLLQSLASLNISNSGLSLVLKTANANVARCIALDLRDLYCVRSDFAISKQKNLHKRNIYSMVIDEKALEILNDLDLWTDKGLLDHPRMSFLNTEEMLKFYLAGIFLATGSINSPNTASYHLEMKANSDKHAEFIIKILDKFNIVAKKAERRNNIIVYVKSGENIGDFLKIIGATQRLFEFEEVRMRRDMNANISRFNNIDIANEQKIQASADKQVAAVQFLKQNDLFNLLAEKEREIAVVRLENPEVSLNTLADIYCRQSGNQLTKSGIRHRLDKITALAEKYQRKE